MEMLRAPLAMSLAENRLAIREAEERAVKHRQKHGDPGGNRHERRLAAAQERKQRKREAA